MPTLTISYETESERLAYERMIAYVREMRDVALSAPSGAVLDACERHAWEAGRTRLRDNLAETVQARIDAEKKRRPPVSEGSGRRASGRGR